MSDGESKATREEGAEDEREKMRSRRRRRRRRRRGKKKDANVQRAENCMPFLR